MAITRIDTSEMIDASEEAADAALSYPIEITKDDDGYFARVPDLPGCESTGDTLEAAMAAIEEAKEAWIEAALELGRPVPEPRDGEGYSGKFVVRVGAGVHRDLVRLAREDGVSLNAFVATTLARETGRRYSPGSKRASTTP